MRDFGHFFGLTFSALLPLISPLRSTFLFEGLVGGAPGTVYRTLAHKIAINTAIFLLAILAMGTALLNFFGISLPVMQVAGGFVLAAMGWSLINQGESDKSDVEIVVDSAQLESLKQKVFYPLTFPITVGPGGIVVMVTLSARIDERYASDHCSVYRNRDRRTLSERRRVRLLWLCTCYYGAGFSADCQRHRSCTRIRVAVHRRTDYVDWGTGSVEDALVTTLVTPQSFVECDHVQLIHHSRAHLHQAVPMP
jgi:small neutral amino acid transporter SnatA (MarC family)